MSETCIVKLESTYPISRSRVAHRLTYTANGALPLMIGWLVRYLSR